MSTTTLSTPPRLLAAGAVAGPLFAAVATAQLLTRDGFDLRQHPISLLSVGAGGWIQIANFIVAGALLIAFAVGIGQAIPVGRASKWGPRLLGVFGAGFVIGGAFPADPSNGFPVGAPETVTWHGIVHGAGPALAFNALTVACLVFARRFHAEGRHGLVTYSVATAVALPVVMAPVPTWIGVRMAVGVLLAFAWIAVLARDTLGRCER